MSLIALDIDEVLLDCISRLNGLAKQLFNANIINQDAWCLGDRYGISDNQVSHIFSMGEGLYANLKPMPYVNSLINLIKSNKLEDKIIFCSSSPEDVIECRVQNLKDIGLDFASESNTFLLGINANKVVGFEKNDKFKEKLNIKYSIVKNLPFILSLKKWKISNS